MIQAVRIGETVCDTCGVVATHRVMDFHIGVPGQHIGNYCETCAEKMVEWSAQKGDEA